MLRSGYVTLAVYLAVAVAYVTLGIFFPDAILSWVEGAAVLVIAFGVAPYIYRRLRR